MRDGETQQTPPRVFISYAQYEPAHSERVLALAHALAGDGLAVELDQFHGQEIVNWPRWCKERLKPENTDFVLMVCTAEYHRRIECQVELDEGRGVFWEGNLIDGYLYRAKANERFVPLLIDEEPEGSLPPAVANWTHFRLRDFGLQSADLGYEDLYRLLTDQPATLKPTPGELVRLPPRPVPPLARIAPTLGVTPDRLLVETERDRASLIVEINRLFVNQLLKGSMGDLPFIDIACEHVLDIVDHPWDKAKQEARHPSSRR